MKKIFIIIIAVFAFISTYSQTEKGKMLIGGSIDFIHNSTNNYDTANSLTSKNNILNLQIIPNFGYFIIDNFAIGGSINYQLITNSTDYYKITNSNGKSSSSIYGGSVFARYYKRIIGDFSFFINGEVNYSYEIDKTNSINNSENKNETYNYSLELRPGVVYFINPKFGLQATFGELTIGGVSTNPSTFTFGLNYYF